MNTSTRSTIGFCAAAALALLTLPAAAIPLPFQPGTYTLPGALLPDLSGPIVFTANSPYAGTVTTLVTIQGQSYPQVVSTSGTLQTIVTRGAAGLDYYYTVLPNDNTYLGAGLLLNNLPTDAQLDIEGRFVGTTPEDRTLIVSAPGDIQTNIASLYIHTSLTQFVETYAPAQVQVGNAIAGADMLSTSALIPSSGAGAVPEPACLGLFSIAVGALAWKQRRARAT